MTEIGCRPVAASHRDSHRALAGEYADALRAFIGGGGETALARGYELGRTTAGHGGGLLDLSMMHHEALAGLLAEACDPSLIARAAQFFAESLSHFEMALRAYQASARLLGLGDTVAKQNAEVERTQEQLRTILDATTAVIYLKDAEGRYLYVNSQFQKVFGVSRDEAIGKRDDDLLPADAAALLRGDDQRILDGRAPCELEQTLREPDGEHTYIALKFPLLDLTGAPYAVCSVATDITERKRADEALLRAKEAAEDANRELESFAYSVAHDLRAPLRSIDAFSRALLEDSAELLGDDSKRYVHRVRDSAHHMGDLIDGLLALSRVSSGEFRRERVDLSQLCRTITGRLRAQGSEPGRRVDFVVENTLVVEGDARLLAIALDNLLGNAWKFTSKRSLARIEVGRSYAPGGPAVFVRDNGAGFDMADADKLFGTFQRLHSITDFEGHGIGLATVHRIVRRHRGRIWAEGEVDVGATFYFTLGDG